MAEISASIGCRIRHFRKKQKMTLVDLATKINKSKATVSKYEKGEIIIDIETLYELAEALGVHIHQLLYYAPTLAPSAHTLPLPAFFDGLAKFYAYVYDGRIDKIIKCAFDVTAHCEGNRYKIMMYMNFQDYAYYQSCENTYFGYIEHHDALTNIVLHHKDTAMEQVSISILASFLDSDTKWGLFSGVSSRPMMPIAFKMLFSRKRLEEDEHLLAQLKFSKEDIRLLKRYNALSVT